MLHFSKKTLAIALLTVTVSASAQFTGGNSRTGNSHQNFADTNPYDRISLSYENVRFSANDKLKNYFMGEDEMSLNGVGVEYLHGFSVSKTMPMFIETGVKFQFGTGSVSQTDRDYDDEVKLNVQAISFAVPVNFTYRIAINDNVNIAPYVGLNFKLNAIGRMKYESNDDYYYDDDDESWKYDAYGDKYSSRGYDEPWGDGEYDEPWGDGEYDEYDKTKWVSLFDKKKMGKDKTWNRFQMGWHVGAGLTYKSLYLGIQYGTDFISAYKHKNYAINSGDLSVKVGLSF